MNLQTKMGITLHHPI